MDHAAILSRKSLAIHALMARFRVSNPRLFGSVLRGTHGAQSDIDILVDPMPGTTLFDLGGLQIELEDLLGCPVDLVTPRDLPLQIRRDVLAEARAL